MRLALTLPGFDPKAIENPAKNFAAGTTTLGQVVSGFVVVALFVAGFMMIFWAIWGIFEYILARGNKENLANARNRIWWAFLGFLILAMAVFIGQYAQNIIPKANQFNKLTPVSIPK